MVWYFFCTTFFTRIFSIFLLICETPNGIRKYMFLKIVSGETDRHGVKFYDDAVCKSFLLQCCPHEILSSTVRYSVLIKFMGNEF